MATDDNCGAKPVTGWVTRRRACLCAIAMAWVLGIGSITPSCADELPAIDTTLVLECHRAIADGWSVDEILLRDELRQAFIDCYRAKVADTDAGALFKALIKLRKAGKLGAAATRRETTEYGDSIAAAEIAARHLQDQYQLNFDQVLVDPAKLAEYDALARSIDPDASVYVLRKAALRLRKSRRLRPELVLRVNDWRRTIEVHSLDELSRRLNEVSSQPGVYIFRDRTGYLYIGQSQNLRERLTKHLSDSDRRQLTQYLQDHADGDVTVELHVFAADSPAQQTPIREAYESELIRSRRPRLNVAP